MDAKAALMAIKADPSRAELVLEQGLQGDRRAFVAGLATWITAALAGVLIDPEHL